MTSLQPVQTFDPLKAQGTTSCEAPLKDLMILTAAQGLVLPDSPFENIIKEIFQKLSSQEEDAIRLRMLALEAEQHWRKELLQKLGEEGMNGATRERHHHIISGFAHTVEPLPMIAAGIIALIAGSGGPVTALAIGAIAIGALMALDSWFGDPGKRTLASALARGDSEDTQHWINRIYMITGLVSLACSIGLGMGTPTLAADGFQKVVAMAASQAANVSDVAIHGAQVFTERRNNTQHAVVLELEDALRSSDRTLKLDLATIKRLNESVKSLFDTLESSLKAQEDCASRICNH